MAGVITPSVFLNKSFFRRSISIRINRISGLDITFVTSANTDKEAFALLREFGVPFKNLKK
jgi:large subunit ribosomal protein L5